MVSRSEMERRKQIAVEMILDSEGLTNDLTDEEARLLLDWGLHRAELYALATQDIADPDQARLAIARYTGDLRQIMRRLSRQAGQAADPLAELQNLLAAEAGEEMNYPERCAAPHRLDED